MDKHMKKSKTSSRQSFLDRHSNTSSADLFADLSGASRPVAGQHVRVHLDAIHPDPSQARWLLPDTIRAQFIAGKINSAKALSLWKKHVEQIQTELKGSGQTEGEIAEHPEVQRLQEIESLAESIQHDGQVNDITALLVGDQWFIETGERRYWAHVWLVHFKKFDEAEQLPVKVVEQIDPFRQAAENSFSSQLNAVSKAREIARLILASQAEKFDPGQTSRRLSYAECRATRERLTGELNQKIQRAMSMSYDMVKYHHRLLDLTDKALDTADRANATEKVLRPVVQSVKDPKWQTRIVLTATEHNLTADKVQWWCAQGDLAKAERELLAGLSVKSAARKSKADPIRTLYSHVTQFIKPELLKATNRNAIRSIAAQYVSKGDGVNTAKQLRQAGRFFDEVADEVETMAAKQKRKQE